jgi:tRNA-dihydrouridine synthase
MHVELNKNFLYLAPLRGFTDCIFRNAFTRHFEGFDAAIAPFIPTVKAKGIKASHLADVLPENNSFLSLVPQIIGNDPEEFVTLAGCLFDLGFATVNWNLGCPYPMVAKKQRGSGLLPYPEKIDAFLEKTMMVIPNRLSIKTRLGRRQPNEILELMPIFNRYPLEEIIIHPRTAKQMYAGEPDLDIFAECIQLSTNPVTYNGDITDLETYRYLAARFNAVDRWMIGRGAIINPFLPAIIKSGSDTVNDKFEKFRIFYEDLFEQYRQVFSSPEHLLTRMKGFWTYFSQSFKDGSGIRKKIHRTDTLDNYLDIVERFFETEAKWVS